MSILYLGPSGSHHEFAAKHLFPDQELRPIETFSEIFQNIKDKDQALVAIENSIGGDVHENFSRLFTGLYRIKGEIYLQIKHHLLLKPGSTQSQITRIL